MFGERTCSESLSRPLDIFFSVHGKMDMTGVNVDVRGLQFHFSSVAGLFSV